MRLWGPTARDDAAGGSGANCHGTDLLTYGWVGSDRSLAAWVGRLDFTYRCTGFWYSPDELVVPAGIPVSLPIPAVAGLVGLGLVAPRARCGRRRPVRN